MCGVIRHDDECKDGLVLRHKTMVVGNEALDSFYLFPVTAIMR